MVAESERQFASTGILIPLTTFAAIGLLCFIVFCFVRTIFTDVYAPRSYLAKARPPVLHTSPLSWLLQLFQIPESTVLFCAGLDGLMLLRIFKTGCSLFSVLSIISLSILAPINFYANNGSFHPPGENPSNHTHFAEPFDETRLLRQLTVENVPQQSPILKIHLLFTWVFSFIAYYYLIYFYKEFVRIKFQYQEFLLKKSNMGKIDMRTIMVYGIPKELRDEVDLALYFESLNIGKVESVVICRRFTQLKRAVHRRAYYLCQLEALYNDIVADSKQSILYRFWQHSKQYVHRLYTNLSHLVYKTSSHPSIYSACNEEQELLISPFAFYQSEADPNVSEIMNKINQIPVRKNIRHRLGFLGLFGKEVNALEYYVDQFIKWDRKVQYLRRTPEISPPTSVGFITFESPESAVIAAQINIASKPFMLMTRQAPEPRDLFWSNISSSTADPLVKLLRGMIAYLCMFFMIFFSTVTVSAISSLIDLDSLSRLFPVLKTFIEKLNPVVRQFIQGVIPTVVLAIWTSSLPSVLLLLSQFQGLESTSWIEMSVLSKYFFYQLWNILLVVVSSTIFKSTAWPIQSPKDIIEILGNSLPQESPTLINYAILQALASYPAQLLLAGPLVLTWMTRLAPWSQRSPRQVSDAYYPSTLTSINYGIAYSVPLLIWVIGLTYAPIAPLILPFCTLFYAVGYMVLKYLLLYVHIPQYESGGMHAPMAIRRLLIGMVIMQLTMMGVLALKNLSARERSDDRFSSNQVNMNASNNWSGYVTMVLAVMPLLFFTASLFWWFRHGYEREISHLPMDLLSKVARDLTKTRSATQTGTHSNDVFNSEFLNEPDSLYTSPRAKEMDEFSKGYSRVASTSRASNMDKFIQKRSASLRGSILDTYHIVGQKTDSMKSNEADVIRDDEQDHLANSKENKNVSSEINLDEQSFMIQDELLQTTNLPDTDSLIVDASSNPTQRTDRFDVGDTNHNNDDSHLNTSDYFAEEAQLFLNVTDEESDERGRNDHLRYHLEPPMVRVLGVLDAPLNSSVPVIPEMNEETLLSFNTKTNISDIPPHSKSRDSQEVDLQVHSYLHPALIGRLPQAWLAGELEQPKSLVKARQEQARLQLDSWRRLIGKQRLGMRAVEQEKLRVSEEDEDSGEEEYDNFQSPQSGLLVNDPTHSINIGPSNRQGRRTAERRPYSRSRQRSVTTKIRSFIDGVTSWAYMQMS